MDIFIVFRVNADSYNGQRHFIKAFTTLEKAEAQIPENIRKISNRGPRGLIVSDYDYYQIEHHIID